MTMILLKVDEVGQEGQDRQDGQEGKTQQDRASPFPPARPLPRLSCPLMADFVTIFTTASDVEARVVRGLLEAHGVLSIVSSEARGVLPVSVGKFGEVRIAVHADEAGEALRIIDSHRTELRNGELVRLRDEFGAAAADHRLPVPRSRAARARADPPRARTRMSASGSGTAIHGVLGDAVRLGFVIAASCIANSPTRAKFAAI